MHCTDPISVRKVRYYGKSVLRGYRFQDNGHYIGHDEPSVKFISHQAGSGNTMTYIMKMPVDPRKAATANGSVTTTSSSARRRGSGWRCATRTPTRRTPASPTATATTAAISSPNAGGLGVHGAPALPAGHHPVRGQHQLQPTKWCAAITIDSLEAAFGFKGLNTACEEPVNFAFLQRNGKPAGPPSPQLADVATDTPNAQTLEINSGDVIKLSITDPKAGFTARINDLTTGQSGFMTASAANGFMDTNYKTCAGIPHTFHAEYSTARQQNQVPWAALEGGVLMQQETGHFESLQLASPTRCRRAWTAATTSTRTSSRPAWAVRRARRPSARARAAPPPGCASTPPPRASRARSPARPTTRAAASCASSPTGPASSRAPAR